MSKIPDVQEAVRRLEGVAHAAVRWPELEGPATLRVEFASDADRAAVTRRVIETLREVGDVDLSTMEVRPPPESPTPEPADEGVEARPSDEGGEPRPSTVEPTSEEQRSASPAAVVDSDGQGPRAVFVGMTVERGELDTVVEVSLRMGERRVSGRAEALATGREGPRSAAMATVTTLRELLPSSVRLQLDWVERVAATSERPEIVHSAVTYLSRSGEETVVGSSIVRRDVREAAVRATLDAVNRRMGRLMTGSHPG